jgi:hypothetical protein
MATDQDVLKREPSAQQPVQVELRPIVDVHQAKCLGHLRAPPSAIIVQEKRVVVELKRKTFL